MVQGLGAASGIQYYKKQLYLISDDQVYLYQYDFKKEQQQKIKLEATIQNSEVFSKKDKLDFEAIMLVDNQLYCIGSGSKENRTKMIVYDIKKQTSNSYDLSKLFQYIRDNYNIDKKDFNIEGIAHYRGYTYMFNRGNGLNKLNLIFKFKGLPTNYDPNSIEKHQINLPIINGNQTTFSDALIVDNQIIYTATIEAESTVYKDGEVKESIVGAINLETFALKNHQIIATNQKIEGITMKKKTSKYYEFLFCEDNDDNSEASKIYELKFSKDLTELR